MEVNKKKPVKMEEVIVNIICVITIFLMIWLFASFIDTNIHNISDFKYATWNIFNFLKYFR